MKKIYFMVAMLAILINAFALDRMSFANMIPTGDPYDVVVRIGERGDDKAGFIDYEIITFKGTGDKGRDHQELIRRLEDLGGVGVSNYKNGGCSYFFTINTDNIKNSIENGRGVMESVIEYPEDCDEYQVYTIDVATMDSSSMCR